MARMIDADKLKNVFDIENETFLPYEIRFIIDGEQTVDAVPVVRCKDCKHYDNHIGDCMECDRFVGDDDYCSFGERKDGEQK